MSKNSKHQIHLSTKFARTTINAWEELAGLLGSGYVIFHSEDNNAKVPMGLTIASKQASLLMHMEYKVTLQDQNYVIVPQRKLILTANGDMRIQEKNFSRDAVTFSGPTYCAIQSTKYSGSSAYHQLQNMKRIRSLDISMNVSTKIPMNRNQS